MSVFSSAECNQQLLEKEASLLNARGVGSLTDEFVKIAAPYVYNYMIAHGQTIAQAVADILNRASIRDQVVGMENTRISYLNQIRNNTDYNALNNIRNSINGW